MLANCFPFCIWVTSIKISLGAKIRSVVSATTITAIAATAGAVVVVSCIVVATTTTTDAAVVIDAAAVTAAAIAITAATVIADVDVAATARWTLYFFSLSSLFSLSCIVASNREKGKQIVNSH